MHLHREGESGSGGREDDGRGGVTREHDARDGAIAVAVLEEGEKLTLVLTGSWVASRVVEDELVEDV